jgi:hypothetical protein
MSADNWANCPKCYQKPQSALEKVRLNFYGKVSADEYEGLVAQAKADSKPEEETPLREDWDLGCHEGKFYVSYSASCRSCGWGKSFEHEEKVP